MAMETTADDPMLPLLIDELRKLLIDGGFFDGINLFVALQGSRVLIHIMAVSTARLGVLLASLSNDAELGDPDSLSCRITPAGDRSSDRWQYELIASRYPIDQTIVFSAKIWLLISDLPEVLRRLQHRC